MTDIHKLFLQILTTNNWGIYFKGEPLQVIPTNDSTTVYKVNEVNIDMLFEEIQKQFDELENNCQKNTEEKPTDNRPLIG